MLWIFDYSLLICDITIDLIFQDLICSPSDVLEPRKQGTVRVAITVSELLRFYQSRTNPGTMSGMATHISSGQHLTISSGVHL